MSRGAIFLLQVLASVGGAHARSPWTQKDGEGLMQLSAYGIGPYDRLYQQSGDDFRLNRAVT